MAKAKTPKQIVAVIKSLKKQIVRLEQDKKKAATKKKPARRKPAKRKPARKKAVKRRRKR